MKSYPIFLALIIFFQFSSLTYQQVQAEAPIEKTIEKNKYITETLKENQTLVLNLGKETGYYYLTILSSDEFDITIINKTEINKEKVNDIYKINFNASALGLTDGNKILNISATKGNTTVEITSVIRNNITTDIYGYAIKDYSIDQEEKVNNNSFIIFLDIEQDYEKFDMKFKFNDDDKEAIKGKNITFGFICLPTNDTNYIALGKNYLENEDNNLTTKTISDSQFEERIFNRFRKNYKDKMKKNKPFLAFIFSVDYENKTKEYSYSINSEIINIFLIVSIVIALVFAVITFFLIRRKQSSESSTIENTDGLLKDGDKGENEGKDENEGKEDEEKDEKEEKKENEEKDEKEDDNVEEEKKKIKAAEN